MIQGAGSLSVIGGGTLVVKPNGQIPDAPWTGFGNNYQNTYAGGTTVSNATINIPQNGAGYIPSITGGSSNVWGSGPLTLNNGAGLAMTSWQEVHWANALNLSGTISIQAPGNGLFFEATAGNVTTLTDDTTLNLTANGGYQPVALDQPISGAHSITVNSSSPYISYASGNIGLVFGNANSTFSGGVTANNNAD